MEGRWLEWTEATIRGINGAWVGSEPTLSIMGRNHWWQQDHDQQRGVGSSPGAHKTFSGVLVA